MKKLLKFAGKAAAAVFVLATVTGMAITAHGAEGTIEGPGYDTPREAAAAYIEAFCEGDISGMLACCAVETYVDHYQLSRELGRTGVFDPFVVMNIPPSSPFAREMAVAVRRASLADMIKKQYLSLIGSDLLYGEEGATGNFTLTEYASAEDMAEKLFPSSRPGAEFRGEFIFPLAVTDKYYYSSVQSQAAADAHIYGADVISSLIGVLYADGRPGVMFLGLVSYGGRLYVTDQSALGTLMGINSKWGGAAFSQDEARNEFSELTGLVGDAGETAVMEKVTGYLESIHIESEEPGSEAWKAAYDSEKERVEESLAEKLTAEEHAVMTGYYNRIRPS